jgi:hypothetical protein
MCAASAFAIASISRRIDFTWLGFLSRLRDGAFGATFINSIYIDLIERQRNFTHMESPSVMSEKPKPTRRKVGAPRHGDKAKVTRSITVNPDLWDRAIELAQLKGESVSGVIHSALTAYVEEVKPAS